MSHLNNEHNITVNIIKLELLLALNLNVPISQIPLVEVCWGNVLHSGDILDLATADYSKSE